MAALVPLSKLLYELNGPLTISLGRYTSQNRCGEGHVPGSHLLRSLRVEGRNIAAAQSCPVSSDVTKLASVMTA